MPHSGVQIKIDRGGGVTVFCGSVDIGQGSDSILAGIVAEELGIHIQNIIIVTADTDLTPVDLGSYSSRVTLMTGNAAIAAVKPLREQILSAVSDVLKIEVEDLIIKNRKNFVEEKGSRELATFVEVSNGQNQNLEHLAQLGAILLQIMEGIIRGLELDLHQITAILPV